VAGTLAGLVAFASQAAVNLQNLVMHPVGLIDYRAPFLGPEAILVMALLGGFLGLLYAAARTGEPALARWRGVLFATLLAVGLQPLLYGRLYVSSVVVETFSKPSPEGPVKWGEFGLDLWPPWLELGLMAVIVFLMGLLIHQLLSVAPRLVPRLPPAVHVIVIATIGLPGGAIFGLLLLVALGAIGGD